MTIEKTLEKLTENGIDNIIITLEVFAPSKEKAAKTWEILINEGWFVIEGNYDENTGCIRFTAKNEGK